MRYEAYNLQGEIIGYDRYATRLAKNLIDHGETCFEVQDTRDGSVAYQTEPSENWPALQRYSPASALEAAA